MQLADAGSVLLVGPAGIGKSTVLSSLAADRPESRVLRASAAEVESGLPYLTLLDLFTGALAEHGSLLPGHLRAALDAALLRTVAPATPQDELAVRLAVLELLRVLAALSPVLLVIDDLHWVDEPSAGVLRFVARRLSGLAVQMIATERSDGSSRHVDLCPEPCTELSLGPLSEDEVADLLRDRFDGALSRPTMTRIHAASGGNPLFAVELGRALSARVSPLGGGEPLPVPDRLRGLLAARLAALPGTAAVPLMVVAAAARPTRTLIERAGVDPDADLAEAVRAGVLAAEANGMIGFSHPLLREMVYADADQSARLLAHERLAAAVDDPVERARHLALARNAPDEGLASTLADAAAVARRRGAPVVAADLARLAADRSIDEKRAAERRLDAARHAFAGGSIVEARRLATEALRGAAGPATRVEARLLLVELAGQDQSGTGPLLDAATADAEDVPRLVGRVRLQRAAKAFYDGDTESALAEVKSAEEAAERASDTESLVKSLAWRAHLEAAINIRGSEEIMERAAALSRGLPLSSSVVEARHITTAAALRRGEVAEAVRRIETLRAEVERSGTVRDLADVLHGVASVYTRAGRCVDALAAGRYCMRLFSDISTGPPGNGLLIAALVELAGGTVEQAETYVRAAIEASEAAKDEDWLKGAYAVQGQILLLGGDPVAAVEPMRRSYALEQRRGPVDPAGFMWHADFVEALTAAGARDEASGVLAEVRAQARRLERHVVELGLDRADAVLLAAGGDPRSAAEGLAQRLHRWAAHPYPIELARGWHTLGTIERRAHRRGAAREALTEAIGRYSAAGAGPWRAVAEGELARLDGARGAGLSETERRIVELVRSGATNREIARSTFLSIKAVEANLTRLYRRFGVRGRDQLAQGIDGS
ncbi:AAA family ATPase [Rugosimonospora acidiphila]|uniref:AAA family ATPase n=1 Tax=Rugosimonospora acidiphila TaxID=556531 RepID=UPI0031EC6939